jgi:integrase/recombinase XerC
MLTDTATHEFLLYLDAERGYSEHTIKSYRSDLRLFCGFAVGTAEVRDVEGVTTELVRSWVVEMKRRGLSGVTIARRLHALRSLWRYLLDTGVVATDPVRRVSTPKRQHRLPTYLHVAELRALLDAAQRNRLVALAFRDYAIMAVLAYTGVRRGELLGLRLGDVDPSSRQVTVRGKGAKWRVVQLADEACVALADWLEFRPKGCPHDYLFTTSRGNRIHPSRLQRIWQSILERSGVRRTGVSLHTLRHSAATLLLQSGACDIVQLRQLLGRAPLARRTVGPAR